MDLNTRPQTNYRGKRGKKNVSRIIFLYSNPFSKYYMDRFISYFYIERQKNRSNQQPKCK